MGLTLLGALAGCDTADGSGAEQVLVEGADWELTLRERPQLAEMEGPELTFFIERASSTSRTIVSDYTVPATVDEASSFAASRDDESITLVAGPVHEEAHEVIVQSTDGTTTEVTPEAHYGVKWYWSELDGSHEIADITAFDQAGDILDEYTREPMPLGGHE